MTPTETRSTDRLPTRRRYRRLVFGSVGGGVAAGLALRAAGYPLAGEVVHWFGLAGFLSVLFGTPVTLFDERDAALERRASYVALTVGGAVLVVGTSVARPLPLLTDYAVPAVVAGAVYGYVALFAVAYVVLRYRP